jgi:hypothetical protein
MVAASAGLGAAGAGQVFALQRAPPFFAVYIQDDYA